MIREKMETKNDLLKQIISQAVEKVFSQQPFLSLSEFLPVKTAKKEK
ncbi:hypothetical protein [Metabacillus rhizolycopersici]|uniref:Uncharacterized protein n=1 Tax=Metabacillus rhizolycopersici TaxID=2875709 RepID=A0ABS7UYX1_9BACI|nr:hypothetical protein [Metabacillus rhizolycopersici]MBZ5753237.1 hypothetical protein [Metabacillus rhizolycopersici]